tara:strand:+ start:373 stop:771 length:399 start_codon:yes stop_codon:yes gene_type:complete
MKKYLINTNIIVTFFTVLFLYTFFLYPQSLNSLVTGSYSSVQLIQTQKYIVNFLSNLSYPFIYNLGNGFDLIADSPQSVLHPLYNFISFNILIGMVLWSEMTIYEGPKYLIEVLGLEEELTNYLKQKISLFW